MVGKHWVFCIFAANIFWSRQWQRIGKRALSCENAHYRAKARWTALLCKCSCSELDLLHSLWFPEQKEMCNQHFVHAMPSIKGETCALSLQSPKTLGQQKLVQVSRLFEGLYLISKGKSACMNQCDASSPAPKNTGLTSWHILHTLHMQ